MRFFAAISFKNLKNNSIYNARFRKSSINEYFVDQESSFVVGTSLIYLFVHSLICNLDE